MPRVLDGIRVFDLTLAAVGPWASKLLGQLGADVIHVEGPKPELAHHIPPEINGTGVLYISANYNKRNIVLDLKQDADRAKAFKIIEHCDVFVQNMRPGAVEKLGLGYDEVARTQPGIIYVSASAYGRVGPMATEAGVDPLLQAFCGWSSITGAPGSSGEMFRHYAHLDLTTSSMIVEAVLAALLARARSGRGQHIEIEMLAAALSLQTSRLAEYFASPDASPPIPMGSACATTVPHQAFRCLDATWLAIGVETDDQWLRFCTAIGLEELGADERYRTNRGRVAHREDLVARLETHLATKPRSWWALRLQRAHVPHARPSDFDELRHHPQVLANGFITDLGTAHFGTIAVEGAPWRFSHTPAAPVVAGGLAGEHTNDIVAEMTSD